MTDRTTAGILDLIDAAIDDYEMGPDAVRYNAPAVQTRPGPRLFFGDGIEIPVSRVEWTVAPFFPLERMQSLVEGFDQATWALREFSGTVTAQLSRFQTEQFKRLFMRPPCRRGWDCLCHSAPFPAARDYRRRTKHRNRRRR